MDKEEIIFIDANPKPTRTNVDDVGVWIVVCLTVIGFLWSIS